MNNETEMKIENINVGKIINLVNNLVKECAQLQDNPKPGNQSGYFVLRRKKDCRLLMMMQIGECPSDRSEFYATLSNEKSMRLYDQDDLSSWISRDESNYRYGGAILTTNNLILSFSGLPELADEAVMLVTALALEWINHDKAGLIAQTSDNPFFHELKNKI